MGHRIIWQADSTRDFSSSQGLKREGIRHILNFSTAELAEWIRQSAQTIDSEVPQWEFRLIPQEFRMKAEEKVLYTSHGIQDFRVCSALFSRICPYIRGKASNFCSQVSTSYTSNPLSFISEGHFTFRNEPKFSVTSVQKILALSFQTI